MSKPSFENIDKWFFDYLEGNLSPKQRIDLEHFVSENPELEAELQAWKNSFVEEDENTPAFHLSGAKPYPLAKVLVSSTAITVIVSAIIFGYFQFSHLFLESKYLAQNIDVSKITFSDELEEDVLLEHNNLALLEDTPITSSNETFAYSKVVDNQLESQGLLSLNNTEDTDGRIDYAHLSTLNHSDNLNELVETINGLNATESLTNLFSEENIAEDFNNQSNQKKEVQTKNAPRKTSLRKRFQTGLKQAKKMLDQPVALSNSRDPNIHVPMMTGYQANFGMAGSTLRTRFQNTARSQWNGSGQGKIQNLLSYDSYIYAIRGGLGIDLAYSNYGDGSIQDIVSSVTYSPKFSLGKNVSFEPAIRLKMGNLELDQNSQLIGSRIERNRGNILDLYTDNQTPLGSSMWFRDIGTGFLLNTKWFYSGVNVDNVRRHYNNIYSSEINDNFREDLYFTAVAGTEYKPFGKEIQYNVYSLYQRYGDLNEIWVGGGIQWHAIDVGISANQNKDFVASLGVKTSNWSIHYNLDFLESRLLNERMLSHQVSLRLMMKPDRYVAKFLS